MKLIAVLEPDQDGGFTVTVPALPECISEGEHIRPFAAHTELVEV